MISIMIMHKYRVEAIVLQIMIGSIWTAAGVVYYVKPTEPCAHNSSCPSNETCHTMDHYASNSSHYFSPDHINVTLYFTCGVHNCTNCKPLEVYDLQSFSMIGQAGRRYMTINMPVPLKFRFQMILKMPAVVLTYLPMLAIWE